MHSHLSPLLAMPVHICARPPPSRSVQVKEQLSTGTALVCSCAHGRRGADATAQLAAAGFQQVVNLEGGLARWSDEALPHDGTIKRHH